MNIRMMRCGRSSGLLGSPVVPFWVPLRKPNSRKEGSLFMKGLQGSLVVDHGVWGLGSRFIRLTPFVRRHGAEGLLGSGFRVQGASCLARGYMGVSENRGP